MARSGIVRSDEVRAHLQQILDSGRTMLGISQASGVSETVINRMMLGETDTIMREIAKKLLALTADDVPEARMGHDATGIRRRLQAMAADGYPMPFICAALDTANSSRLIALRNGRRTTLGVESRDAIKALYERLKGEPGPDEQVRRTARYVKGWLPSSAWEGVDIDDPEASPPGCADA